MKRDAVLVMLAFAAVYVVWGSTYLAIAWAVEGMSPLLMIGLRSLTAGAVLYAWARSRGSARPMRADWTEALVTGVMLFVTGQAVLAWAETRIASGPAALILATEPVFIALLGWRGGRLLRRERGDAPAWSAVAAMVLGFVGIGLLVLPGGTGGLDLAGAGAATFAAGSWSAGMLRTRARPGITSSGQAGMQLLMGGTVLVLLTALTGGPTAFNLRAVDARAFFSFAYLVVFGSVVTYAAYVWLLERVGPSRVSTHAYVNPVVAIALGAALAGEPLGPQLFVATALVLTSVALMLRPAQRRGEMRQSSPSSSSVTRKSEPSGPMRTSRTRWPLSVSKCSSPETLSPSSVRRTSI